MAADWCVSSKDVFKISFLQFIAAVVAALFANYLSSDVSFISNPTRSVKRFCLIFSIVCYSLLRLKSKVKFTILQVFELIFVVLVFSIIFHIMAILYGAPLSENSEETFCWALLVSMLTTVPSCSLLGVELDLIPRICFSTWSDASPESYFQHVIALTVIGTWVGAFPIPLDWDRPWQAWPIPCVVGAIVGYIMGLGTSAVTFAVSERRQQDETKLI